VTDSETGAVVWEWTEWNSNGISREVKTDGLRT
jgi:hypothetical protein